MKTASLSLLGLVGALMLLASSASAFLAYSGREADVPIGSVTVKELAAGRPDVLVALCAQRGTAAAFGAGFATFFLFTVFGPYKRGDASAWWAILAATLACTLVSAARIPFLGTRQGAEATAIMLVLVVIALLLDARRLRAGA
jgi:hypothetical protein